MLNCLPLCKAGCLHTLQSCNIISFPVEDLWLGINKKKQRVSYAISGLSSGKFRGENSSAGGQRIHNFSCDSGFHCPFLKLLIWFSQFYGHYSFATKAYVTKKTLVISVNCRTCYALLKGLRVTSLHITETPLFYDHLHHSCSWPYWNNMRKRVLVWDSIALILYILNQLKAMQKNNNSD